MPAPKFGILLTHKDPDIKKALHLACFRLQYQKKKDLEQSDKRDGNNTSTFIPHFTSGGIFGMVNEKLKQQAKEITDHFTKNPTEVASFTFESILDMLHPLVWNMISIITATVEELRYIAVSLIWDKERIMFPSYSKPHGSNAKTAELF